MVGRFTLPNRWRLNDIDPPDTYSVSMTPNQWWLTGIAALAGAPGGWVRTTYSQDGLVGRNVTTPIHAFNGEVNRAAVNAGGRGYMYTHSFDRSSVRILGLNGDGLNSVQTRLRDDINDIAGPQAFDYFDGKAKDYARKNFEGC